MIAITNDGKSVSQAGNSIYVSNGEAYLLSGRILTGPRGVVSCECGSRDEAMGIVIGLHGGRKC